MATIPVLPGVKTGLDPNAEMTGLMFADNAVGFTALGIISGQHKKCSCVQLHLFALAIESALKSLALRSGATLEECEGAGHRITKMIALSERYGSPLPGDLKFRLSDDKWFQDFFLMSRYPQLGTGPILHKNYPEIIQKLLETPCKCKLKFDGGSAEAEIRLRIECLTHEDCLRLKPKARLTSFRP